MSFEIIFLCKTEHVQNPKMALCSTISNTVPIPRTAPIKIIGQVKVILPGQLGHYVLPYSVVDTFFTFKRKVVQMIQKRNLAAHPSTISVSTIVYLLASQGCIISDERLLLAKYFSQNVNVINELMLIDISTPLSSVASLLELSPETSSFSASSATMNHLPTAAFYQARLLQLQQSQYTAPQISPTTHDTGGVIGISGSAVVNSISLMPFMESAPSNAGVPTFRDASTFPEAVMSSYNSANVVRVGDNSLPPAALPCTPPRRSVLLADSSTSVSFSLNLLQLQSQNTAMMAMLVDISQHYQQLEQRFTDVQEDLNAASTDYLDDAVSTTSIAPIAIIPPTPPRRSTSSFATIASTVGAVIGIPKRDTRQVDLTTSTGTGTWPRTTGIPSTSINSGIFVPTVASSGALASISSFISHLSLLSPRPIMSAAASVSDPRRPSLTTTISDSLSSIPSIMRTLDTRAVTAPTMPHTPVNSGYPGPSLMPLHFTITRPPSLTTGNLRRSSHQPLSSTVTNSASACSPQRQQPKTAHCTQKNNLSENNDEEALNDADSEDDAADIGEDNEHSGQDDDVDICHGLLAFGPDSPFFKHDLAMQDERLSKLAKNLKEISHLAKIWMDSHAQVSQCASDFVVAVEAYDWREAEFLSETPMSIGGFMQQLCAVIKEGQANQAILLFSLDSSFITPIRDFYKNTIRIFQNNYRLLLKMSDEYELALNKYLLSKQSKQDLAQAHDPHWLPIKSQHCKYEQCRFDLTYSLLALHTEKKVELLERLWVVQHHFAAYYHSGHDYCQGIVEQHASGGQQTLALKKVTAVGMRHAADSFRRAWWKAMMTNAHRNDVVIPSLLSVQRFSVFGDNTCLALAPSSPNVLSHPMSSVATPAAIAALVFQPSFEPLPVFFVGDCTPASSPPLSPRASDRVEAMTIPKRIQLVFNAADTFLFAACHGASVMERTRQGQEVERAGYLCKQTTSLLREWKRRWFHLKHGHLFYYRSAKADDSELIVNVLLCTVRECHGTELRNCFEIISPNRRIYLLQADTEHDMRAWIKVIQASTEHALATQEESTMASSLSLHAHRGGGGHTSLAAVSFVAGPVGVGGGPRASLSVIAGVASGAHAASRQQLEEAISLLHILNPTCADCLNEECSGIHRSLGVHISKVRSLTLDGWDMSLLKMVESIGNDRFNAIWEGALQPKDKSSDSYAAEMRSGSRPQKPDGDAGRDVKEEWVRLKYVDRAFLAGPVRILASQPELMQQMLATACSSDDLAAVLPLVAGGVDLNLPDLADHSLTAMHRACAGNFVVLVEYLLQNNARTSALTDQKKTPYQIAEISGSGEVMALFQRKGLA